MGLCIYIELVYRDGALSVLGTLLQLSICGYLCKALRTVRIFSLITGSIYSMNFWR
ncbi:Hypothetical predicted protein [Pelobates cultripes]|uniref:Uncharacterized protein n=1 Tax=Pelobates cultripes TaxID=61616 RepID=A0AAD1RTU0_PELCU|nr:Hypothetical predicted protein [Pelobates cultripes]